MSIPVLLHDDSLILRSQKRNIFLKDDWRKKLLKSDKISHYWNQKTGESLKIKFGEAPPQDYFACHSRFIFLDKEQDVSLWAEGSFIDVRLNNLWSDLQMRFKLCLKALLQAGANGILGYKADPPGIKTLSGLRPVDQKERVKHFLNALEKVWKVSSYEHNLIITDYKIGLTLLKELKSYDKANNQYPGTVYLGGFEKTRGNKPLKIMIYDCSQIHNLKAIKIEIVFRKDFLKRNNLRTAKQFLKQPDIQQMIEIALIREWKKIFKKAPKAKELLQEKIGNVDLLDFLIDRKNTLTELIKHYGNTKSYFLKIQASLKKTIKQ